MPSSIEDRIQALEVALNNESREKEFYLSHASRTSNSLGKQMFASIAGDEDEHYRRILTLHRRLREEGRWPETIPIEVEGTRVKEILTKFVKAAKTSSQAERDDLEAVKIAIEFETKGELFYADLARKVDNPMEKKFYEFLSSIEREHRLSLEDTMEFFRDPAGWYRIKEKLHVDGA